MKEETPLKLLHMATGEVNAHLWSVPFRNELKAFGTLKLLENTRDWSDDAVIEEVRRHDVVFLNWGARRLPEALAEDPGKLRYICNLTGEIRPYVSRRFIEAGISVSNWGHLPAAKVAEGALALLMTVLKQVVPVQQSIRDGNWSGTRDLLTGSVNGLHLGVYGLGVIGNTFLKMVRPLQPELSAFDPYVKDWPENVRRAESLAELFDHSDAVVVLAALTAETRHSIDAGMLARLPDGGIVINVARGAIIDQPALFRELESGRLRAGLDVLDTDGKDYLPPGHPGLHWPNLVLSGHRISGSPWNQTLHQEEALLPHHEIALGNLKLFVSGKPLQFSFDLERYDRTT